MNLSLPPESPEASDGIAPPGKAPVVHADCRQYRGDAPCAQHKRDGRTCEGCASYEPTRTRILVIKLGALGDVLRTTAILPALRRKYAGCEVTWVTRSNAAPLLRGNALIDRILVVEENYLEFLQHEEFDVGLCPDAEPLSATIHALAHCRERSGFIADRRGRVLPAHHAAREWWMLGLNDDLKRRNTRTYQDIVYRMFDLPLPVERPMLTLDPQSVQRARHLAARHALHGRRVLGVNTGGGGRWQHKKWTFDGYARLIELAARRHPDIGILLLGGPEEVELNRELLARVSAPVVDAGCNNTLDDFAALISMVDVLVTSDSLGMHLSVALERPTVVLVGPTSPSELHVYGRGDILHGDVDCISCYLARCDKPVTCMERLSPERVLERAEPFLGVAAQQN